MKKLLKSEVYGSRALFTEPTDGLKSQNFRLLFMHSTKIVAFVSNYACQKKKKKGKKAPQDSAENAESKLALGIE